VTGSVAERRLARLARSGIHFCEDASKHARDLKDLADEVARADSVEKQTRLFKALADETRLRILNLLRSREMCVCEIMIALGLTQPTASHHLKILEGAELVKDVRKGKWVFYKIANPRLVRRILGLHVR
jgi:DNA-binding transcriptional ArsR family regulator